MLITIVFTVLGLLIWLWIWLNVSNSELKTELEATKLQLKNLITTYNNDTDDLHNKLADALWAKHNLRQELVKVRWELIDAKRTISTLKGKAYTKKDEVNTTDNTKHIPSKKRWRPKKN